MPTLAARLFVTGLLLYSGLAKLGRSDTSRAARDLGVPPALATWVGRGLAPVEILVAMLLVPATTFAIGAVLALALFTAFAILVGWNLSQGRKPACACFGDASPAPISRATLARNITLVALAALLLASAAQGGTESLPSQFGAALAVVGTETALALVLLLQAGLSIVMLARPASPRESPAAPPAPSVAPDPRMGWPIGTLAPSFDLPVLGGGRESLRALIDRGRPVVLLFTAPDCSHCQAMLPEVQRWQETLGDVLTLVLVSRGSESANRAESREFEIRDLLLQGGTEVADAYQCPATPAAVVVDRDRRIASRIALGPTAIRELIEDRAAVARAAAPVGVLSPPPPPDGPRVLRGDPAPPFRLPALRGDDVDLREFGGKVVVVIFWSPTCRYCRALAPILEVREKAQHEARAQIVFVASGARAANDVERFVSPFLLDEGGRVAAAFGATGTPQAMLIDAQSRIGSGLATGADEVQSLLDRADLLVRAANRVTA